jgi:hypothetical protein
MFELVSAYRVAQAVSCASTLGIADALMSGPASSDKLAGRCSLHPGALGALMRVLEALGVVSGDGGPDGAYALTPAGQRLAKGGPGTVSDWAQLMNGPFYAAWGSLGHTVRTGRPGHDEALGEGFWDYLRNRPELEDCFQRVMAASVARDVQPALALLDLSRCSRLIDVGGGSGETAAFLLARYAELRITLVEQPDVAALAADLISRHGFSDRCDVLGQSFLEDGVPHDGDVLLLCRVLGDWDDEGARRILRACRQVMAPASVLAVVTDLRAPSVNLAGAMRDLDMLVLTGGWSRDENDYASLFAAEALRLRDVHRDADSRWVLLLADPV